MDLDNDEECIEKLIINKIMEETFLMEGISLQEKAGRIKKRVKAKQKWRNRYWVTAKEIENIMNIMTNSINMEEYFDSEVMEHVMLEVYMETLGVDFIMIG